ncbi:DNA replication/repair protein RecF [Microvirga tunisiensis]|uniref:DNA replication/repair protein RecF n=2 Tax=Pannonibacter tanglangensis TaxID=2750084 RepID=A0ABW9ZLX9_9HYPH|nr:MULTISPECIES: DNA replication/repair protein RecF [unclassified Pannonibacter]NBN65718.1 DNA replication/repair protein RecF [Pannonibacter sp. XCT-34]NBN80055.1 DNA replication/repair protein RecF [Pannonibacter sp. XCT-53]
MTSPAPVAIDRLLLTDFRNYSRLALTPAGRLVALVGNNGIGKTNVLEAISFLSAGRGLRRAALPEIARRDGDGTWAVAATLNGPLGDVQIGTGYAGGDSGRRVRIDGAEARSSEALLEHVRVLWLVPAMDGLFTGPAGDRRRFLDRLTLSIDPAHGRRVNDLEKALSHRNRLLDTGGSAAWLDAVEQQLAGLGLAVAAARRETLSLLRDRIAAQAQLGLPFPVADLSLEGEFETAAAGLAASDQEDLLRRQLRDGRARDRAAGRTLSGPHRTDLSVIHQAKQMPAGLASTGEQKALLIGLILAHADLTAAVSGLTPILLLDEVAAHLDPGRRKALFSRLVGLDCQVFMTGTDAQLFADLPEGGEIVPLGAT